jgi:poly(3-hydroxybutyrate) depolymerase
MRSVAGWFFSAVVVLAAAACSSTGDPGDANGPDSGSGARVDASTSGSDAGTVSSGDAGAGSLGSSDAASSGMDGGDAAAKDGGATSGDAGHAPDAGDAGGGGAKLSAGCGKSGGKTGDFTLDAKDGKGQARTYEVLVPSTYDDTKPLALSFVYHGAGGNSAGAKAFGLQNAPGASAAGIFVFPQGIDFESDGVGWDDTCGGYDMAFFDTMLATLEADYCVDEARVFVAGFSWGGDQTTALDCCRGSKLRAVAVASSTDEFTDSSKYTTYANLPCPSATTASIRFTHATGGDSAYPAPDFATTSALYRSWNACSTQSTAVSPSPCVSYDACKSPLVECSYDGLGHALPSGWGNDTWAFFSAAP